MSYSSLGKRFCAAIIDSFICGAIGSAFVILTGFWPTSFLSLILAAAYYILCEGSEWHATLGKKLMNIKVVNKNGQGIDYKTATIRYLSRMLSGLIFGIGFVIALFNDNRQCLHDKLADTYVVDGVADSSFSSAPRSIVGVTGEVAGKRFPIIGNGIMIGRDPSVCQVVLKKSNGISRIHCFVSYNPQSEMYILSDRNSSYGTFTLNGMRVTANKSVALKKGERFYLATLDTMFEVQ